MPLSNLKLLFALILSMACLTAQAQESSSESSSEKTVEKTETKAIAPSDKVDASAGEKAQPEPQSDTESAAKPAPANTISYKVVGQVDQSQIAEVSVLGKLGPPNENPEDHPFKMEAQLSGFGGSLWQVNLSDYTADVEDEKPETFKDDAEKEAYRRDIAYTIQKATQAGKGGKNAPYHFPYRPISITINGEQIKLRTSENSKWLKESEGVYSITIYNKTVQPHQPVLKVTRKYALAENSYMLTCQQSFKNLSAQPLEVVWKQNGSLELPQGRTTYVGDKREAAAGYFNPHHQAIRTDNTFISRRHLSDTEDPSPIYHGNEDIPQGASLKWLAFTNRYFAVATTRLKPDKSPDAETLRKKGKLLDLTDVFATTSCAPVGFIDEDPEQPVLAYFLTSPVMKIKAGETHNLDYAIYMGGRDPLIFSQPAYADYDFDNLLRYTMGGPCTFCTFQWLARGLLSTLRFFSNVFGDWGIAIILLVLCVRLCLHPITKKSQINMAKMGKQMQALQPELEKLKNKYPDDKDKHKLSQEMMALYREKGVNPANFLGCLPMFLQMPIWIALYAMLYFAIELRHQPGFYGIFQWFGHDTFLADLAMPDRLFVFFDDPEKFTLIFIDFDYSSLNVLPILMGIFWFYNQKLSTPKASTPEQETQQKMMRYMTLTFPIFMYSAPSGLTLYIMASSIAGVVDSLIVKRHIKKEEEAGTLFTKKDKKPPKPGSLRHRLGAMMEAKKAELEERMQEQQEQGGQPGMNRSMQRSMQARNRTRGNKNQGKRKR